MGLFDRLGSIFTGAGSGYAELATRTMGPAERPPSVMSVKDATTMAPYATALRLGGMHVVTGAMTTRRSARLLRHFADRNEALRTAINWRKQQISQAKYQIVRTDEPKKPPNPKVVAAASQLFRYINPTQKSLRSLLDQVIEDVLVLDSGCIEKELRAGRDGTGSGPIANLWPVDGSTIAIDPAWELAKSRGGHGCDPKAIRYRQFLDGKLEAELRNDQLVYIMETETTHRTMGWSRVETLVNVIEAELYGEKYDFDMLKQSAPAGFLDLGGNLDSKQVAAYRAYYASEIAGTQALAIYGGGDVNSRPKFERFGLTPEEMQRESYKAWLIGKIAFVFQMDKTIFGLVDDVNRSTSKTMSARTDQGFIALARLVAEYFTREIIWTIDENHGFQFTDLMVVDELVQAKVDQIRMQIGATFPNEVRARDGLDPVPWGDEPYNASSTATPDPLDDDEKPAEPDENDDDPKPGDDDKPSGGGKTAGPFGRKRRRRMHAPKLAYLAT